MHENLAVGYHQQDTDYYCGAACAQMVLDSIGAGILDQVGLYNDNHSHSTTEAGWASGPDGLTWTLNHRKPASFGNYFALFELASEDATSRKIVWTIHHYHVAPVALVYGSQHWVTVRGYEASAAPAGYADNSYAITSFDVNNPWPPTPSPPPPPPHAGGDVCGGGGDRGVTNEHIAYATWQSTYMTGATGGHWVGKFLAVCDPEPPPKPGGRRHPTPERANGEHLLTSREAARWAVAGLKRYGLVERQDWRGALAETEPAEPVLVERLDRPGEYYYIVPMTRNGRMSAATAVDARYGDYQQAVALPEPGPNHLDALRLDRVDELLAGRRIQLPDLRGERIPQRGLYCVYPTLVWRPCRESLSPYYPFRMVTIGDDRLYIRSDGAIFTRLHVDGRGI